MLPLTFVRCADACTQWVILRNFGRADVMGKGGHPSVSSAYFRLLFQSRNRSPFAPRNLVYRGLQVLPLESGFGGSGPFIAEFSHTNSITLVGATFCANGLDCLSASSCCKGFSKRTKRSSNQKTAPLNLRPPVPDFLIRLEFVSWTQREIAATTCFGNETKSADIESAAPILSSAEKGGHMVRYESQSRLTQLTVGSL